jgi:hypothetical protein
VDIGKNFPLGDYYRHNVLDAETISRSARWWTAALLIRDPRSGKTFVGVYKWQLESGTWKQRNKILIRSRADAEKIRSVLDRLGCQIGDESHMEE